MSEEKQKFFQFPLALLAYGANRQDKIAAIIAYGMVSAGFHREEAMGGEEVAIEHLEDIEEHPEFDIGNREHRAWALGKSMVGFYFKDPKYAVQTYRNVNNFLSTFGKTPQIRVPCDLVQEVYNEQFEFRDFCVLCAVYAPIGDKQYAIVRRDRVRAGALGYSSGDVLFDEDGKLTQKGKQLVSRRPDKAEVLTTAQCRYTLDKLHTRKFFSRFQPYPNARRVYYSRSLSHEELAEKLVNKLEKKLSAATAQDAAQQLYREKAALLLKRLIRGEKKESTAQSPDIHQNTTAGVTGDFTAGVAALICSHPNECFCNSCSLNVCPPNEALSLGEKNSEPVGKKTVKPVLTQPTEEQFNHHVENCCKGVEDFQARAIRLEAITLWGDMQHGRFSGNWMTELFKRAAR